MNNAACPSAAIVKRANRKLYDAVSGQYESVDGRRDAALTDWIRGRLLQLARDHGDGLLLDVGSGSGVVTRAASGVFKRTIALDLSPGILAAAGPVADDRIAADLDLLPITSESVNVVSCFAVLHHLFDATALAREVARVLKPGGAFWSDHDMDMSFYRRFRWPLSVYRRLRAADARYAGAAPCIDAETYALAEYRENGVDSEMVVDQLRDARLTPTAGFHWFGLSPLTNRVFGHRQAARGWAPLISIVAVKPKLAPSGNP